MGRAAFALLLTSVLLLAFPLPPSAQALEVPSISWARQFGSSNEDLVFGMTADATGVYAVGRSNGNLTGHLNAGYSDAAVWAYDLDGNARWLDEFGTVEDDYAKGVAGDGSSVYVVGATWSALPGQTNLGWSDGFIRRYDLDGTERRTIQFGTNMSDEVSGIHIDEYGVFVLGMTFGAFPNQTSNGGSDVFVRAYDADLNATWTSQFGSVAFEAPVGIDVDASGVYVAGTTDGQLPGETSMGSLEGFVRKYSHTGNVAWTHQFGTDQIDEVRGLAVDATGVYVSGYTRGAFPGYARLGWGDVFLRAYDLDGGLRWTRQFGTALDDSAGGIATNATGIHVAGYAELPLPGQSGAGKMDAFVRKYDSGGNETWTLQFGTPEGDWAEVIAADDSGVYVAGGTEGTFSGEVFAGRIDGFVARLGTRFLFPRVEVAPTSLDFGEREVGSLTTANVTVSNLGEANLMVRDISLASGTAGFSILGPATPFVLPIGASVDVGVAFSPVAQGPAADTLRIASDDPDRGLIEIPLAGTGVIADLAVVNAHPRSPLVVGLSRSVDLSVGVANVGSLTPAAFATLAFRNASAPSSPFTLFPIAPLPPGAVAGAFAATWTSPPVPGTYLVEAVADVFDDIPEADESNNTHTWTIDVVSGPLTDLVIGEPNVTAAETYVTSHTTFAFSVFDQSGTGIRNTTFRVDDNPWTNYTASGPFSLSGEGEHIVEWFSEDFAGNVEDMQSAALVVDDTPPTTDILVGSPKVTGADTFVASSTPLTLTATDGGVGLDFVECQVDGGSWNPYTTPFTLPGGDGPRTIAYRSSDRLGNQETAETLAVIVDDTPPTTTASIGDPKVVAAGTYVTSQTLFTLTATDGGVGLDLVEYRVDGGSRTPYGTPFTLPAGDGPRTIAYRAADLLGNQATEGTLAVIVDDTPPDTQASRPPGALTPATPFTLTAADAGSGVADTMYRVDDGPWTPYGEPFTLPAGHHTLRFRSTDLLGNEEPVREVPIDTLAPTQVEANWKPLVAAAFAIVLLLVGRWSSKRRPWRGGTDRSAVAKAFLLTSFPFVLAEVATGVASWRTGALSIPPGLGAGTVVDVAIFAAGVVVAVLHGRSRGEQRPPGD